jgi:hypothetical protein
MSERKAHPPNESAPDSRQEEALVRAAAPVNTKVPTAPDEPQQVNAPQEELALCLPAAVTARCSSTSVRSGG